MSLEYFENILKVLNRTEERVVKLGQRVEAIAGTAEAHYANVEDIITDPAGKRLIKSRWTTLVVSVATILLLALGWKLNDWLG